VATTDHLVARSGATAVVSTTALTSGLTFPDDVRIVCPADVPATTAQGASQGTVQGVVRMSPDSLVYAIPTSGTTGIPKLVGIPHGAVVRLVWQNRTIPLGPDDRTMLVANSSFDAATLEVWGALANGGAVVVPTPAGLADPAAPCAALERHRVTAGFLELPVITNRSGGRTEDNLTPHYPRSIRAYESQFTRPWCFWRTITVGSAHLIIVARSRNL